MKVFKFGGASVKDAKSVVNVSNILKNYPNDDVIVVISAMGKTTNALEDLHHFYINGNPEVNAKLDEIKTYHNHILKELFTQEQDPVFNEINNLFIELEWAIESGPTGSFDFEYDQIVSLGEMLSTRIVEAHLRNSGIKSSWLDVRDIIRTDDTYREGRINWAKTKENWDAYIKKSLDKKVIVTQGFIGVTDENFTTTLGREGSDFTGAILANISNSESLTIWKDVPGFLNADPKWFEDTIKLDHISFLEAIELSYYGATIIHPKTIKPLQNKGISLYVKSFIEPEKEGSLIDKDTSEDEQVPSFIFKMDQVLISIKPPDFSFIVEDHLSEIFSIFHKFKVRIHLMQNSALSFSVCCDFSPQKTDILISELKKHFSVRYNSHLELVTVRHYDDKTIERVTENKELILEQKSRHTARIVMKDKGGDF